MKTILILSLLSFPLFAQDFTFDKETNSAIPKHISELKEFKGKVFKNSGGKITDAEIGTRFAKTDIIVIKERSFAKLVLVDDSTMTVGASSELKFSEIKFIDKKNRSMIFDFIKGQVRATVKNKAKDNDIQFRTKVAVMGIRGTEILANHRTVNGLDLTEFALLSGKALVTQGTDFKTDLNKHEHLLLIDDVANAKVDHQKSTLSEEIIKKFEAEDAFLPFSEYRAMADVANKEVENAKNNSAAGADADGKNKKNWRENLKKLNEELKKNQKK